MNYIIDVYKRQLLRLSKRTVYRYWDNTDYKIFNNISEVKTETEQYITKEKYKYQMEKGKDLDYEWDKILSKRKEIATYTAVSYTHLMKWNKIELKTIMYDFNCRASRLINTSYKQVDSALKIFIDYIENTDIINDYINTCNRENFNVENEVKDVQQSYGRYIFDLGNTCLLYTSISRNCSIVLSSMSKV